MRIGNTTQIDMGTIRAVISFVRPNGISKFDIHVKNCSGLLAGSAYHEGCGYHGTATPLVVVRVGESKLFPARPIESRRAGYLPTPWMGSRVEALVYVMAHELRHLWQAKVKSGWRVWGARGQFSERDADAYAIRKLREWRKSNMGGAQ